MNKLLAGDENLDTIDKKVQEEDQKVSGGMPGAFESDQTAADQAAEIVYTQNPERPEAPEGRESAARSRDGTYTVYTGS